jgi:3-hydroxybutyryl-CoA dehydratase
VGEKAQLSKTITEADIETIADVTGDKNPIHLDEDFAQRTRFKGRIAHGILGMGLISAVLGTKLPGPGAIYLSQTIDFLAPIGIGDKITAEAEVIKWQPEKKIITLTTRCFKAEDHVVMEGNAVLLIEPLA